MALPQRGLIAPTPNSLGNHLGRAPKPCGYWLRAGGGRQLVRFREGLTVCGKRAGHGVV